MGETDIQETRGKSRKYLIKKAKYFNIFGKFTPYLSLMKFPYKLVILLLLEMLTEASRLNIESILLPC